MEDPICQHAPVHAGISPAHVYGLECAHHQHLLQTGYAGDLITNPSAPWYSNFLILGVNAAIVIVLLNAPLVAAISLGGAATKWFEKTSFSAGNIWKSVGRFTGRNTAGKLAYEASESKTMGRIAKASPFTARILSGGLSKVSGAGFGGKGSSYDDVRKAKVEQYKKVSEKAQPQIVEEAMANDPEIKRLQNAITAANNYTNKSTMSPEGRRLAEERGRKLEEDLKKRMSTYKDDKIKRDLAAKHWEEQHRGRGGKMSGFNKSVAKAIRGKSKTEELWEAA